MFRRLLQSPPVARCAHHHQHRLSASTSSIASRSVFVYNLSFDVKSEALKKHMSKAGNVIISAEINMNKRKKSKGSAIVTFETSKGATDAINTLNGSTLYGREALLREDRADLMDDAGEFNKNKPTHTLEQEDKAVVSVYVGNLNTNVTSATLKKHMESVGPVAKATVLRGPFNESHGCGVVRYKNAIDARKALDELYNSVLNGRLIFVREDREAKNIRGSNTSVTRRKIYTTTVPEKGACVILGNVDRSSKQLAERIQTFMAQAGAVKKIHLAAQLVGKGRGKILVEYETKAAALMAISQLHGTEIGNKKVTVQKYGN